MLKRATKRTEVVTMLNKAQTIAMAENVLKMYRGNVKSSKEKRLLERANEFLRNPDAFGVTVDHYRDQCIREHHCEMFGIQIPRADRSHDYIVLGYDKRAFEYVLRYYTQQSVATDGEKQKRNEEGKPVLRFTPALCKELKKSLLHSEAQVIRYPNRKDTYTSFCRALRAAYGDAGKGFEAYTCQELGWRQIGNVDRRSHVAHCDAIDHVGREWELKLQNAFISCQFSSPFYYWADL